MNKGIILGIVGTALFFLIFLAIGYGVESIKEQEVSDSFLEEKYMEGCDVYGDMTEFCECTYDELMDRWTYEEIAEMSTTPEGARKLESVSFQCVDKI